MASAKIQSVRKGEGDVQFYDIQVKDAAREWSVSRRYKEFKCLRKTLLHSSFRPDSLAPLPPKGPWLRKPSEAFLEQRRKGLQALLDDFVAADPSLRSLEPIRQFFDASRQPPVLDDVLSQSTFDGGSRLDLALSMSVPVTSPRVAEVVEARAASVAPATPTSNAPAAPATPVAATLATPASQVAATPLSPAPKLEAPSIPASPEMTLSTDVSPAASPDEDAMASREEDVTATSRATPEAPGCLSAMRNRASDRLARMKERGHAVKRQVSETHTSRWNEVKRKVSETHTAHWAAVKACAGRCVGAVSHYTQLAIVSALYCSLSLVVSICDGESGSEASSADNALDRTSYDAAEVTDAREPNAQS
eukprot:TRINITY_DN33136_c0_g1_i1.p1 TRINITY_DN33136_c0_g1~~TRINITY_DN33136_c0_g1_i1.p1  ORF type:complete len:364 (-),score=63.99 TRINITY_DN33136_c0_g1_i1:102-1193(-)